MSDPDDPRETRLTAAVTAPTAFGPEVGSQIAGRYRVIDTLGLGATGIVVKALDLLTSEVVAVKVLRYDVELADEQHQRLHREAHALMVLRSEHTVRIREVGQLEDGSPFIAMELLAGMDLARLLVANHRLERAFAVDLVRQAAAALAEAHAMGIVHRDVKPSNLFITWNRDRRASVKVLDFGIAKSAHGAVGVLTKQSSLLGTPAYMSPEQIRTPSLVDPRTDVWSLGAVLYEMVEGRVPFVGRNFAEVCVAVSTAPLPTMTHAPELAPVLAYALAKQPGDRFQSAADFAQALAAFGPLA